MNLRSLPERFRNPNGTPGEVFVVAHRGAFIEEGRVVEAENSIPAIERALALGVDMVEVDVHFTADGTAVVLHDADLGRTTARTGPVKSQKWSDIKDTPLVHPVTRVPQGATLPSLEEAFLALKGQMMVNVELKTGMSAIPEVARIARNAGVSEWVTIKSNVRESASLERLADIVAATVDPVDVIPVIIDSVDGLEGFEKACQVLAPHCIECVVDYPFSDDCGLNLSSRRAFTQNGGPLFSLEARRLAARQNIRQFVNTLYVTPIYGNHQWNGGRSCEMRRFAPDSVYSFWIAHGATVIQTDEPAFVIDWLQEAGFRQ